MGGRDIKTFSKLKVKVEDIRAKWIALCLPLEAFDTMLRTGKMFEKMEVDWKKLLGVLCGSIGKVHAKSQLCRYLHMFCRQISNKLLLS